MQHELTFLMVGRIYEEELVFIQIEKAIDIILKLTPASFYFTDAKTKDKIYKKNTKVVVHQFIPSEHHALIDYIITIGGDGTILFGVKEFKTKVPPVITFQKGSLGFMCRFSLEQMEDILTKLVKTYPNNDVSFNQANIMRLQATRINTREEDPSKCVKVCINQVYISRKRHQRITLTIEVDGEKLTKTAGDGILISTPTGSTAYSLSAGGPVLFNQVNGILIVPISPNSLSFRPICLPSTSTITVRLHETSRSEAYASFDGQSIQQFTMAHKLVITRSPYDVTFLQPRKQQSRMPSWISRLKYFLGWNEKYKAPLDNYQVQTSEAYKCPNNK